MRFLTLIRASRNRSFLNRGLGARPTMKDPGLSPYRIYFYSTLGKLDLSRILRLRYHLASSPKISPSIPAGLARSFRGHGQTMATASIEPFLKGETGRNTRGLLRLIILCTIAGAAVASRLFSVISMFLSPM